MATKPTRQQDQACQKLAQALLLIAEAARLDGRNSLGGSGWPEVARAVARASTAFGLDEIVARALVERVPANRIDVSELPFPESVQNANTAAELESLRQLAGG